VYFIEVVLIFLISVSIPRFIVSYDYTSAPTPYASAAALGRLTIGGSGAPADLTGGGGAFWSAAAAALSDGNDHNARDVNATLHDETETF
jgi:hypothetical protein